jgi:hypothetical protein
VSIDYAARGIFTDLADVAPNRFDGLDGSPRELCAAVPDLFIQPAAAAPLGWPAERFASNQLRAAADLIASLWALAPSPLSSRREPAHRAVGTCRHFTVLSVSLLRRAGVPARARCGFATYFQAGQALDHWVTEYRDGDRWVRMDTEIIGKDVAHEPEDLPAGAFLTGAEAWLAFRRGEVDATTFGVCGTENFGPSEIRGNLVRDLASLVKVETLPWDEWGRMTEAYNGATGLDYDQLLDQVADAVLADDPDAITELAAHPDLVAPFS